MLYTSLSVRVGGAPAAAEPLPAEAGDGAAVFAAALGAAAGSQRDAGQRLRDGAVSLTGTPANWTDSVGGMRGLQRFNDWLASDQPFPGFDSITMNCHQWILVAGMKTGAVDRDAARAWNQAIIQAPDKDAERAAIYGDNPFQRIDVAYTQAGGEWRVGRVEAPEVRPGQIISIDGADHVMVVTGRDDQGRILVASFPTVVFGTFTDHPLQDVKPYAGTLEGFLNANLANWEVNDDGANYFLDNLITVGDAAFVRP